MIKISVIVPVYNVEKYIDCCICSLINQTTPAYEIILIDDGSTDLSGNKCDEWAKKYNKIKVVHKKNAGLGMARNSGIELAKGDFILFIDSDDYCDDNFLENISNIVEKEDCDTCKTTFRRVDLEGNVILEDQLENATFKGAEIKDNLIPRLIGSKPEKHDSIPMSACCTLYSMQIIKSNKIQFYSEREWISEDILFNIEYLSHSDKVIVSNYIGYNYRVNPKSLTTSYVKNRFERCKKLYDKEKKMLEEYMIFDSEHYRLSRQFFVYLTMCFAQLKGSGLSFKEKCREIHNICIDAKTCDIVEAYPINRTGIKQKLFLFLVRRKMTLFIYLYYCL